MNKKKEVKILHLSFDDNNLARNLFGIHDNHLKSIEKKLGVSIDVRGNQLRVHGQQEEIDLAQNLLNQIYRLLKKGYPVFGADIENALRLLAKNQDSQLEELFKDSIYIPAKNTMIVPKSLNQKDYIEAIKKNDVVFGIGPAGTGKTYLAVAMGVVSLLKKDVSKIILTRPAVEAGEKLGFLPGDIAEKVNPYLRPLYDALHDMIDVRKVLELLETGVIEVAPIAFMRGRTLTNSFVILDEAQNCTSEQMKMFLTRFGFDSKVVVTGDVTQIDLPLGQSSGLIEAQRILSNIEGIHFQYFDSHDVVRHRLVSDIIRAYEAGAQSKR